MKRTSADSMRRALTMAPLLWAALPAFAADNEASPGASRSSRTIELPRAHAVPGGVALFALGTSAEPPSVRYNQQPVLVVHDGAQWTAVLGIALSATPGPATLQVQRASDAVTLLHFEIEPFRYAEQRLKVAPGQVDLSKADLARYERERVHLAQVAATFSATPPATLRMLQPT
ncbi:MAG TPA: M23 family peptidase, partial [Burkholderiaceae bacterium]|nr:M23 family peptidase [Burkholderiaceae bacterium]